MGTWIPGQCSPHHPKVAQRPAGEPQSHATMASDHFSVLCSVCHHASDKCCAYLRGLPWWGAVPGTSRASNQCSPPLLSALCPHTALISQRPINRSAPSSQGLKKKKTANEILHEIIAVIFLLPGQIIRGGANLAVMPLACSE